MIIAVDGPSASGKGTIARALAAHYGLPHMDTGLLYRATALCLLHDGGDPADEAAAVEATAFDDVLLDEPALRDDVTAQAASVVSAHPAVRAALIERQRRFARRKGGAVLDGRDIGTVIAPDADAKLFIKATPMIRAKRRHAELTAAGKTISLDAVLADIRARDLRDMTRATAPLRQAEDAVLLDTSFMSVEAAIHNAIRLVDGRLQRERA